ncbi:1014_t:CDS:2, partial [Racocetra persica]
IIENYLDDVCKHEEELNKICQIDMSKKDEDLNKENFHFAFMKAWSTRNMATITTYAIT